MNADIVHGVAVILAHIEGEVKAAKRVNVGVDGRAIVGRESIVGILGTASASRLMIDAVRVGIAAKVVEFEEFEFWKGCPSLVGVTCRSVLRDCALDL